MNFKNINSFINRSGKVSIEEVFELSNYLDNEHSYIAWDTFYSGIDYYDRMLASAEVYGDFTVKNLNFFKSILIFFINN